MIYDSWKLDNQWDEEAGRIRARRIMCEDCDQRFATCRLEGYYPHGDEYLCECCYDKRCDYPEPDRQWPQAENE